MEPGVGCGDDRRRDVLRLDGRFNGIDYVEVEVSPLGIPVLEVFLLGRLPPDPEGWLDAGNVSISGGDTGSCPAVVGIGFHDARDDERDDRIAVVLDRAGDASTYTLRLRGTNEHPLLDIDRRYDSAEFSFVVDDFAVETDCVEVGPCLSETSPTPDLDYLARDYASFRNLLFDRLATTLPDWRERHGADLYVTVLEALAYRADHLSYALDAVSTEAYLQTARLRTSVKRHARLVDYRMHEGCNARAWLAVDVEGDPTVRIDQVQFVTRPDGVPHGTTVLLEAELSQTSRSSYEVFEPLPEKGWEEIVAADIADPSGLTLRLLGDTDPRIVALRGLLDRASRAELGSADAVGDLVSVLVRFLGAVLDSPLLDDSERADAQDSGRYLRGASRRRRNRCVLQEIFPEELALPARYRLHEAHNWMAFYTWHRAECCLPVGATEAVLRDQWLDADQNRRSLDNLVAGDVLILEELVNPSTGAQNDVDPTHRHAVRLTRVWRSVDPLGDIPVVHIRWAAADALPFALVISGIGPPPRCEPLRNVSAARGNIVLVDHGETVRERAQPELLDGARTFLTVPFDPPDDVVPSRDVDWCCAGENWLDEAPPRSERYSPRLTRQPLVFAVPVAGRPRPARDTMKQDPRRARPQVALFSPVERKLPWMDVVTRTVDAGVEVLYERWLPRSDLLTSDPDDRHFVVEVDDDGAAHVRFGDGENGAEPPGDVRYLAWSRIGGGTVGNVGRDSICCLVLRGDVDGGTVRGVRNPLPASGGTLSESVRDVRLRAPHEFTSTLERAVTAADYAAIALREFPERLQRAAAELSNTADNRTLVRLFIDPLGSTDDNEHLRHAVETRLQPYVRIGHRLKVRTAGYVPIDLTLRVRLDPHHQWGAVVADLRTRFGNGRARDGTPGFFHPDRITFGEAVSVSAILVAAVETLGVASVSITNLVEHGGTPGVPITEILRPAAAWQVFRLDNDPKRPANGVLRIEREE